MSLSTTRSNRRAGRSRPALESLEVRLALSDASGIPPDQITVLPVTAYQEVAPPALGPDLTIASIDPAPGSILSSAPTTFSVTFDRPIDPIFLMFYQDLRLERLDSGNWVPAFDDFSAPFEELDASETVLIFTPQMPLGIGEYRVVLPAGTFLAGRDGSLLADTGADQVVGGFSIVRAGISLDDALDLGEIGPSPTVVTGSLDFDGDPWDVRLYRFSVPEGHRWRFGAEVSAQREGIDLLSNLTLFDGQGRPLASSSLGRPDAPNDPYLFNGLEPGTYYLGISGRNNVPGSPGGYDPATATLGLASDPATDGAFRLTLAADTADEPSRVVGFALDWADPLAPSPTGFTLNFSAPLTPHSLEGSPTQGLEVVDGDGVVWPVTAVGFQESGIRYHFMFEAPLPVGRYSIRVPSVGGVTDLSGATPVGHDDSPILASFEVKESPKVDRSPNDLGPFYPSLQADELHEEAVSPSTAVSYRVVLIASGTYRISTPVASGPLTVRVLGRGGSLEREISPTLSAFLSLDQGVHYLQFVNEGTDPVLLTWSLTLVSLRDSLLENGVGQGPAMNLRLVTPSASGWSVSSPTFGDGPVSTISPSLSFNGSGASGLANLGPIGPFASNGSISTTNPSPTAASSSSNAAAASSTGLFLGFADTIVGRPTTSSEHVSPVGPTAGTGSVALASAGQGVPDGVEIGPSLSGDVKRKDGDTTEEPGVDEPTELAEVEEPVTRPEIPERIVVEVVPTSGAIVAQPEDAAPTADDVVLADADWLSRIGDLASRLFSSKIEGLPDLAPSEPGVEPIVLVQEETLPRKAGRVEEANFGGPLMIGVAAMLAARYQIPTRGWVKSKSRRGTSVSADSAKTLFRGPHRNW